MEPTQSIQVRPKSSPRDVFTHLLAIVTLYWSAVALGTLFFQFVNLAFPDALVDGYWSVQNAYGPMRFAIASLIVAFPAYLLTMRYLAKVYVRDPGKRDLRIRKWLVYFTLFVAALVMIGDLIALINQFLGGELTARFALKVVAVLLISGAVFYYYLSDVRKSGSE